VFLPNLALSLNNLGGMGFSNLDRLEETLATSQEAVAIYRRLAETRPDAFLPHLAMSLSNLGSRLSDLGRLEEAPAASQEAVAIYRQLVETRQDAFLPELAMSLGAQGQTYAQSGRHADSVGAFGEGLATILPFAERNAFGGLAGQLCQAYVAACTEAGTAPDAALLERVARAIGNDDEKTGG